MICSNPTTSNWSSAGLRFANNAGLCASHKPRSGTTIKHYLSPAGLFSPATGAKPAVRNQERYRTAGRVLPRSPRGECTCVLDPSGDDRKARPGKARTLRVIWQECSASLHGGHPRWIGCRRSETVWSLSWIFPISPIPLPRFYAF